MTSTQANGLLAGDIDWWRGAVIYQIYPRSFQDDSGSGIGDLNGITRRLDHIAGLGVDAIWLSPFFTSPMKDMGYDVSDYCNVDPEFGTLDDFDALVAKAHALGLRVMIDQVLSHSSDQHAWFTESRVSKDNAKSDWYVWADANPDGTPPNNWQSIFGGAAWTWDARRKQYYMHNFLTTQPDLNFHCADVQAALLDATRFWLDRGVDGFRLDTVNFYVHDKELRSNPPYTGANNDIPDINPYGYQEHIYDKTQPENIEFIKKFRSLMDEYPGAAAVGEVGDGERSLQTMAEYTADGNRLQMCYSFDMLSPDYSVEHFRGCVERFEAASVEFSQGNSWPCWAFSNHDVTRHMSRWADLSDNPTLVAKQAVSLLLSLKGSVCLYQGEELGLTEAELQFEDLTDPYGITFWPEFKGRDGCRTPMVWDSKAPNAGFSSSTKTWLPVTEPHVVAAVDTQEGVEGSILEFYRDYLAFRKSRPSLITGDITFLDWEDGLAFVRTLDDEKTLCVFNLSNSPVTFVPPEGTLTPLRGQGDHNAIALQGFGTFIAALG
ncbi:MAG: alpha-glucosidase family protein [Pseudoruegeria sp.]